MFPTTLREIAPQGNVIHVYAEFRGCRYYVGTAQTYPESQAIVSDYMGRFPRADFYVSGRSDSTQIDGAWNEVSAAYGARHPMAA